MAKARARKSVPPSPPPPLTPTPTAQFKRDVKRQAKRGKDINKLRAVIQTLCDRQPLAPAHRDHPLEGPWRGWRDCHVEPDWLLIYKPDGDDLKLARTGTHADLFDE